MLASTLLWMSNGGRHYAPWNGRYINVMGVEDVTGCFHYGAAQSAKDNVLSRQGVKTAVTPTAKRPLHVNHISGVTAIPRTFERVKDIVIEANRITLVSDRSSTVSTTVNTEFLNGTD